MNYTSEPLPDPSEENRPRPRARKSYFAPLGTLERDKLLRELAQAVRPSVEFFVLSLLAGGVMGAGYLLDSPMLLVFGALLAPFLAPLLGTALAASVGSMTFFSLSIAGLLIGSLFVFLGGVVAGIASLLFPDLSMIQLSYHALYAWDGILLILFGAVLSVISLMRGEKRPLLPAAAMAYALYTPICAAGFAFGIEKVDAAFSALETFGGYLLLALLVSWILFLVYRFRPSTVRASLPTLILICAAVGMFYLSGVPVITLPGSSGAIRLPGISTNTAIPTAMIPPTATPSRTKTPTIAASATSTVIPSETPTITFTPGPTPVWAKIAADSQGGARLREGPSFASKVIRILENDILVKLLPDEPQLNDKVYWVKVETVDGQNGWMVKSVLVTATPNPSILTAEPAN